MHFKKILTIFLAAVLTFSSLTVSCVGAEEPEGLEVEVEAESTASAISSQPMIYNAGEHRCRTGYPLRSASRKQQLRRP